ncbi:MAG: tRNA (N6-isopentenyl adenosine(37)-C2)-methylthiotransferase MiaB [Candidatus Omnitrophica bacterium]|nr:tRNA (N6-isopentenyl adenosine(37)-C2)-methylthiotransferase MiaB [Candidatus Omnitrophota bacterium]MBU4458014.1 tRNA (N6-isopentenyl adenosine(37)-C2)-methylthiotransferase MiaB [Candidatus Omnitrophota bacterium]
MNEHDSERVKDLVLGEGYCLVDKPDRADILLFNTCSVRKNAEDRVFGVVSSLKRLKKKRPEVIFGIIGCMAEAQGRIIFERMSHVDFLCGPADLDKIPEIIEKIKKGQRKVVYCMDSRLPSGKAAGFRGNDKMPLFPEDRKIGKRVYVKIMEGCDNFCSYCIVPYVRGRERSRPSKDILEEVKNLIDKGAKDITLLGQNVNSYGNGLKEKITFSELLRKIDKTAKSNLVRFGRLEVDFVTSHPKDAGRDLFKAMAGLESLSKQLHLPLQSGSNKILKRMNRGYSVEKYKKIVKDFRRIVKKGTIVSDFIVGFPGETKKDFNDTLKAAKEIQFNTAYIFKYSPRPFTKASKLKDDVPTKEKERRHRILLETQREISLNKKVKVEVA